MRDVYRAALGLLQRREHSRQELARKLTAKGHDPTAIDASLQQLIDERYLSDERFTEAYIRYRTSQGRGPVRIQLELQERGVSEALIEAHLFFDDAKWMILAENVRVKRFGDELPDDYPSRAKQARFLQQRGFAVEHTYSLAGSLPEGR